MRFLERWLDAVRNCIARFLSDARACDWLRVAVPTEPPRRSTGIRTLDHGLHGGYPRGAIVHVTGTSDPGFGELLQAAIAESSARGDAVVWIDLNRSDRDTIARWVRRGAPVWRAHPDCAEQALSIIYKVVSVADLVILDSTANLVAEDERTSCTLDMSRSLTRLLRRSVPRVARAVHASNATLLVFSPDEASFGADFWSSYAATKIRVEIQHTGLVRFSVADAGKRMNPCAS